MNPARSTRTECSSLITLYDHFGHTYQDLREMDTSSNFCCVLDGITCDGDKIVALKLRGAGLRGEIPAFINDLKSLKILDLSQNNLSGPIPDLKLEALEVL
jgi:hypothetical protein